MTLWENEFFNRAVGPVYNFRCSRRAPAGDPLLDPAKGTLRDQAGRSSGPAMSSLDRTMNLDGRVLSGTGPPARA